MRHLVLVLGDQLDRRSAAFDGFDASQDAVWMAEVAGESTHVWSAKPRIVMFLAAMRHFRDRIVAEGLPVDYRALSATPAVDEPRSLATALAASLGGEDSVGRGRPGGKRAGSALPPGRPAKLIVVEPGEHRVREEITAAARAAGIPLEIRTDRHFFSTVDEFALHARGRKQLRLEWFYRPLREKHGVLMEDGAPAGGEWNFDADNRGAFSKAGPGKLPAPRRFTPDGVTRGVIELVNTRFADHPGSLEAFDWPVTPEAAREALDDFLVHRLPSFGRYQDAIWTGEPWLYHSRLAAAMNLKLLDPRDVVAGAERAWREGLVPIEAAEGFIRQVIGWREYVRGVYWHFMPEYESRNALGATLPLPAFYWTAATEMNCLRDALSQTLTHGYAHHIQRLMILGNFLLLAGINPREAHDWFLEMYIDAHEWVMAANVLGMALHADGGFMATKPYAGSAAYISKMGNYCSGCAYDSNKKSGPGACPFNLLYWDFYDRHADLFASNPRTSMMVSSWRKRPESERETIRQEAATFLAGL